MSIDQLAETAEAMVAAGKGIIAIAKPVACTVRTASKSEYELESRVHSLHG